MTMFVPPFRLLSARCLPSSCVLPLRNQSRALTHDSKWYANRQVTHSYAHGAIDVPLMHHTVGDCLRLATERVPDQEVFIFKQEGIRKTYEQFYKDAETCASGLLALGLEPLSRVGIWGPNKYEWAVTQFATALAGLILVNVNPAYQSEELEHCLEKSGISCLIMSATFKTQDYYSLLERICPAIGHSKAGAIDQKSLPLLKHVVIFEGEQAKPGAWDFHKDLMQAGDSNSMAALHQQQTNIMPDMPVNVQFTSGTTGAPKGATLTHHGIVNNAFFIGHRIGYHKKHHMICCPPPFYHCFGCVAGTLATVVHQLTCVFPAPSFDPAASLLAAHEEKCTSLYGTPTMFIDMVNHPTRSKYDFKLETGVMAGAPCPTQLCMDVINKLGLSDFTIAYGATETSPVTFQSMPNEDPATRVSSVGAVAPHVEAVVVDQNGHTVPLGERGELYTRGYTTMIGYWNDEQQTQSTITPNRWYKTGDQATMTADGRVMIVGRTKDCIIRGGENIYPAEIEDFLFRHPKIEQIQVVGVPDERMGEAVCAWISLKNGETATEEEIKTYCKGKITHYKIPQYIQFKTESDFPVTVTGKPQKFRIREIATEQLGLSNITHYKIPKYIQFKSESDFPVTVSGKSQKRRIREIATEELELSDVKAHYSG